MEPSAHSRAGQVSANDAVVRSETKQRKRRPLRVSSIVLWFAGLALLLVAGFIVHNHPATWPLEREAVNAIQGPHPVPCPVNWHANLWESQVAYFINTLNDPIDAVVIPIGWMIVVMLFRLILQAFSLGIAVLTSSFWWLGIEILVKRPRATAQDGVCVHRAINAFSFPSGHVIHDVVLYGFLLYLSFSEPVRCWRYRWLLLPLQVAMVVYMLAVGYARLLAGEHHLFDVLGGYLAGLLWLFLCIFLYRWLTSLIERRHLRKKSQANA
ncbi:MAG TPA: phosphatase PAP2 family protein [Ktedonosporobacter sp.]|nr:phosphatase PAP2 family protein [Ktedonosporobacter sp.]